MLRLLALLTGAVLLLCLWSPPSRAFAAETTTPTTYAGQTLVGPTMILFEGADSVLFVVSKEWASANVRHQEKLLRHSVRMDYWLDHIPADMRMVYDALGYPTGRVLLTPVAHTEEWWYYGQLAPPLRFRDGELIDTNQFENLIGK